VSPLRFADDFGFALEFVNFLVSHNPEMALTEVLLPLFADINRHAVSIFTHTYSRWIAAFTCNPAVTPAIASRFAEQISPQRLSQIADPDLSHAVTSFGVFCVCISAPFSSRRSELITVLSSVQNSTSTYLCHELLFPPSYVKFKPPLLTSFAFEALSLLQPDVGSLLDATEVIRWTSRPVTGVEDCNLLDLAISSQIDVIPSHLPQAERFRVTAHSRALSSPQFRLLKEIFFAPPVAISLRCFTAADLSSTTAFYSKFELIFTQLPLTLLRCALSNIDFAKIPDTLFENGWPIPTAIDSGELRAFSGFGRHLAWMVISGLQSRLLLLPKLIEFALTGRVADKEHMIERLTLQMEAIRAGFVASGFTIGFEDRLLMWIYEL
jgi:hypothetical protein